MTNHLTIKNWSEDDKPREKFLSKGKEMLSDAELIAVLIGSGNRDENAVALSKRILNTVNNNLNELAKLEVADLMKFNGIGEAKAISILTALELGARKGMQELLIKPKIKSSKDVFMIMNSIIGDKTHEEFWIIFLNNSNKILFKKCFSKGGITATIVDKRLVFKKALELHSTSIILIHNHPSGNLKPSSADLELTKNFKDAGEIMGIKILDHLIVTSKEYLSFTDEGIL